MPPRCVVPATVALVAALASAALLACGVDGQARGGARAARGISTNAADGARAENGARAEKTSLAAPPRVASAAPPRLEVAPDAKVAANAACETCHADVATEWQSSLHAQSWDDPVFLAAYAIEPLAFCRGCHAPEAPLEDTVSPARHLGVGCMTCHVPEAADSATGAAPTGHVRFARRGADPEGCAPCHEFAFPEPQVAPMQSTVSEHAASPERGRSCGSCHMPARATVARLASGQARRDHTFRVQGDAAMLRRAVAATARRDDVRIIEVSLAARGAGHAVPTGDMFRRFEVLATAGEGAAAITAAPVVLAREFTHAPGAAGSRRLQVGDARLAASGAPRTARLVFPRSVEGLPVRWQVVYHRMGPREAALFGVDRDAEAVVVAEGVLRVSPLTTPFEDRR